MDGCCITCFFATDHIVPIWGRSLKRHGFDRCSQFLLISSFVKAMVEHYYLSDGEVQKDCELQDWIKDIFTYGLLGNRASGQYNLMTEVCRLSAPQCDVNLIHSSTGFPESFSTVEALVKFITVVIFTASGQHGAVNSGQVSAVFLSSLSISFTNVCCDYLRT